MSIAARILAWQAKLPPAETRTVTVEKDLPIALPDGVVLLADHYIPQGLGDRPTVLIRSVYTDRTKGGFVSRLIAERGFHVLVVSGRGTCGSGGTIDPFASEHDDGLAVLAWLEKQDWFNGALGTTGASYLGFTQWAIARDAGPPLKAMSTQLTGSDFRSMVYPGDALSLEIFLGWISLVHNQEKPQLSFFAALLRGARRRAEAARHLPLGDADTVALGTAVPHWRHWLAHHRGDDPWWARSDHSGAVADVTAPNHLVSGWRDMLLPMLVRDYLRLRDAGREPYLTIGPWGHWDTQASTTSIREGLLWLRAHLLGDRDRLRRSPVRIYLQGAGRWLDLDVYPPQQVRPQPWHLHPGGGLAPAEPPQSPPDRYRYDPADPTPATGRPPTLLGIRRKHGEAVLKGRTDVLTYTSRPLQADLDVIGIPAARLHASSNAGSTDFYVRLCDIAPSGKVTEVSDGLRRLTPAPDASDDPVEVELWPTAHRFRRDHRLRVQIAGGAFPRWDRNLGTGEPPATATEMRPADQQVYHDPAHPSAIVLPVAPPLSNDR